MLPTKKEQKSIITYIESKTKSIDIAINSIQKQVDLVKEYRTSLISSVVTGKVDVRHIPIDDTGEFIEDMDNGMEDEGLFREENGEEYGEVSVC